MRLLAAIQPPEAAQTILDCLGLPARAPPRAPALPNDAEAGFGRAGDFDVGD